MYTKNYFLFFLLVLFVSAGLQAQTDPRTTNLTHSWTFEDGTPNDYIGHANGTLKGGAIIKGGALITFAQGQWMQMPADSIAINKYQAVTLEAWYTPTKNANPNFTMLAFFGNTQNSIGVNYYFMTAARQDSVSRTAISCNNTSTPWSAETGVNGPEFDDGKLHHMVSTLTSDSIKLYIDGNLTEAKKLDTNNAISRISTAFAYLAKSGYNSDPQWIGKIHEFNIYNKALDSSEVRYLYNKADIDAGEKPVTVEAESGVLGSNFSVMKQDTITYVTEKSNYTGLTSPGDTSRIITYQVAFKDTGYYNLFVHLRVGPGTFNDDSFFYGKGFGSKNDTAGTDWVFINGLASAGFSGSSDVVDGPGTAGSQIWKWVNVTKNSYQGTPGDSFYVSTDSLTRTFQIGSREDGLDIDKFAFGKTNLYYTVNDLDKGLPGSFTLPVKTIDSSLVWKGPALAAGSSKFLGSAFIPNQEPDFNKYWTQLTPENAGKWGSVAGTSDTNSWNWSGLDASYNYAMTNHLVFKDHNLIWGQQQPSWISSLDSATQLKYIETWFRMVGQRYPKTDMIDVVNEPLNGHNPPDGINGRANYKKALGGNGKTGWDWVVNAFKLARKYLPNTKLLINDYGILNSNSNTDAYIGVINILKDSSLIDGIGCQAHGFENTSAATIKANLDKLAATGLPIYISEFDLNIADDNTQKTKYQEIFPVFWQHPDVKGVTLWGYIQGLTWVTSSYLVHTDGTARPALFWLAQYIANPVGIKEPEAANNLPKNYDLEQNYPNPFNPATNIRYSIVKTSKVTLRIFDILGREVKILVNDVQAPGIYTVTFDAQSLASGIYFYQINATPAGGQAGSFSATKKLVLLK
jgi:endo-1,4-beta-xylanase